MKSRFDSEVHPALLHRIQEDRKQEALIAQELEARMALRGDGWKLVEVMLEGKELQPEEVAIQW